MFGSETELLEKNFYGKSLFLTLVLLFETFRTLVSVGRQMLNLLINTPNNSFILVRYLARWCLKVFGILITPLSLIVFASLTSVALC